MRERTRSPKEDEGNEDNGHIQMCRVEVNCLPYCFKQLKWQLIPSKNSILALLIWPNAESPESTDAIWLTSVWSIIMFHDFVSRLTFWFDYYINESNKRFSRFQALRPSKHDARIRPAGTHRYRTETSIFHFWRNLGFSKYLFGQQSKHTRNGK